MDFIKSIETEYKGYKFRSQLEARWAVFFDALKIKWEYEPEGFVLSYGLKYLPDFKLHNCDIGHASFSEKKYIWADVKGVNQESELFQKVGDLNKIKTFSNYGQNPIIILPNIPENSEEWFHSYITTFEYVDGDYYPCIISKDNLDSEKFVLYGPDYYSLENEKLTDWALSVARGVKFKYGTNESN